jgi:hypothetical protein
LLKTGLSARGYLTATSIMELEKVLVVTEGEGRRFPRDHEAYFFSVFGRPATRRRGAGVWKGTTSRSASMSSAAP